MWTEISYGGTNIDFDIVPTAKSIATTVWGIAMAHLGGVPEKTAVALPEAVVALLFKFRAKNAYMFAQNLVHQHF